ncbi:MAG TPA: bifunctional shikimate kinase/3-dehydroquinate synthase [Solirubrobacterales bacterium]|nr:bifunctional shikimate kinase/3-dehydroquinate synthase [Solirubrobacterales bacterium]
MATEGAIVFVGYMGAGKSEAARAAGDALGEDVVDADDEIERELGESIASFFEREGEAGFREREQRLVLELLEHGGVISLGGGAVESAAVAETLRAHVGAWCRVDEDVAWERSRGSGRPLAVDRDQFGRRFAAREPLYERAARAVLPEGGAEVGRAAAPWLAALRARPELRMAWASSPSGAYPAIVGPGAAELLGAPEVTEALGASRWFAIADAAALSAHRDLLPVSEAVIEVEAAEERKTLAEAERVLRDLAGAGARRDDGVIAFGGGVVGDLAGFCAASYQRGIALVHVPTTLVAQVDSAYGGKTGVDLPEAKNYVGAYHMPAAVLADPRALATLPDEELAAGFVEVVKTALIAGGELWERVAGLDALDPASLDDVVFACARTKIDVVVADERDRGGRAVLNLGHTVGHAIEAATGYGRYRHGEAVGLGLLAALRLSEADELRQRVRGILERHGLPTALESDVATDDVLAAVELDKKRTADGLGFVLVERPGEVRVGARVNPDVVRAAVDELRSES